MALAKYFEELVEKKQERIEWYNISHPETYYSRTNLDKAETTDGSNNRIYYGDRSISGIVGI